MYVSMPANIYESWRGHAPSSRGASFLLVLLSALGFGTTVRNPATTSRHVSVEWMCCKCSSDAGHYATMCSHILAKLMPKISCLVSGVFSLRTVSVIGHRHYPFATRLGKQKAVRGVRLLSHSSASRLHGI